MDADHDAAGVFGAVAPQGAQDYRVQPVARGAGLAAGRPNRLATHQSGQSSHCPGLRTGNPPSQACFARPPNTSRVICAGRSLSAALPQAGRPPLPGSRECHASRTGQHRIDFGFDEPFWFDEAAHLHDGVDRPYVAEELTMYLGNSLPVLDPRQDDSRTDDIL